MIKRKNILHGNKLKFFFILLFCFHFNLLLAENEIISSPLINLSDIKPSFEEIENLTNDETKIEIIQKKKKSSKKNEKAFAELIGLDKITAKTSEIIVNLGETQKYGPLEIKVLKCGQIKTGNFDDNVAYLQVKDLSENQDDKVFIFNGWTFSSDPSITPFDHAIYDLQLVNCSNV